jgi:dUTP pyrophosphatase
MSAAVVTVRFFKLSPEAQMPSFAHADDAGMDLTACEDATIASGESILIHTGLAVELPPNTEAQVRPRSGLALKHQVTVLNSPGTIDEGYRGEIGVILINHGKGDFKVSRGMKVAQLVVKPLLRVAIEEASTLSNTRRGVAGFGSTGI